MRRTRRGLFRLLGRKAERRAAMKRTAPADEFKRLVGREKRAGDLLARRGVRAMATRRALRAAERRGAASAEGDEVAAQAAGERQLCEAIAAEQRARGVFDPIADVLCEVDCLTAVDSDVDALVDVVDRLFDGDVSAEELDVLLAELDRWGL